MSSQHNERWWQALLDGKPHDVDIRETDYGSIPLLRAAIYYQAQQRTGILSAKTKQLSPDVLRVQAYPNRTHPFPRRGQVDSGEAVPLPPFSRGRVRRGPETNPEMVELVHQIFKEWGQRIDAARDAGLPEPTYADIVFQQHWQDQIRAIKKAQV